ncbi:MAG: AMIN domain-containing protein [bacterium]|nr:AMIN domain-containing protein [bacterium]
MSVFIAFHMIKARFTSAVVECGLIGKVSVVFLLLAFNAFSMKTLWAQEFLPIVDTAPVKQRIQYQIAAPSGEDEPLEQPEVSVEIKTSEEKMPEDEAEPSAIEKKIAEALKVPTLEEKIHKQIIQKSLEQFGYDVFSEVPSTFAPVTNIPVPWDYIIGPGDTLVIQLYGKLNVEYTLVVTRDGRLLIPELGPVQVAGLTFSEVKEKLINRFGQRIIGANASVTMGQLRSIQIYIFGDVVRPGFYTVSGLTTLMNALLVSGGVKRTGTLRNIQLKRKGRMITVFDFYDVLLHGNTSKDHRLSHGDVIFVPSIGPTVGIGGEVQRPAIYELKNEKTVKEVIDLSGGLLPTAALKEAHIERIQKGEFRTLIDLDLDDREAPFDSTPGDTRLQIPISKGSALSTHTEHLKKLAKKKPEPDLVAKSLLTANSLRGVTATVLKSNVVVNVKANATIGEFKSFTLSNPPRIVFDMYHVTSPFETEQKLDVKSKWVKSIRHMGYPDKVRLVVDTRKAYLDKFLASPTDNGLLLHFGLVPLASPERIIKPVRAKEPKKVKTLAYHLSAASTEKKYTAKKAEVHSFETDKKNFFITPSPKYIVRTPARKARTNSKVRDGDLIRIFPVADLMDDVVLLGGHVRRPGGYQWHSGMRLSELITSPLDLLPNADFDFVLIQREVRTDRHTEVHYVDLSAIFQTRGSIRDPVLYPRDQVIVFNQARERAETLQGLVRELEVQVAPYRSPMVFSISGHVRYQGKFPLEKNARILDVLKIAGGPLPGADLSYALIRREIPPKQKIRITPVNLEAALSGPDSEENPAIKPLDKIYVFDFDSERAKIIQNDIDTLKKQTEFGDSAPVVSVQGWIRNPGQYPLVPEMRVSDLVRAGGNLKENAYGVSAELTRYRITKGELRVADHIFVDLQDILFGNEKADLNLMSYDHLILHKKPEWREEMVVELKGEVIFPGKYPIKRGETLSNVVRRAGGFTDEAYVFGAVFTRESVRVKEQEAFDRIQQDLDDLLVQLMLSPSFNNAIKLPAGEQKHLVNRVIKQLEQVKAVGRVALDLEGAMAGDAQKDIVLEDGDKLYVSKIRNEVTVMGEVYYPASHLYLEHSGSQDYVKLSGGPTVLARKNDTYVVQANGEVIPAHQPGLFADPKNIPLKPGATVYVPLDVDRITTFEKTTTIIDVIYKLSISAAALFFIGSI